MTKIEMMSKKTIDCDQKSIMQNENRDENFFFSMRDDYLEESKFQNSDTSHLPTFEGVLRYSKEGVVITEVGC